MQGALLSLKGTCQEISSLWRGRARSSPLSPCTCRPRVGVRADDDSDNENNRKQQGETPLRLIINYTNSKQSSLPSVWEGETISLSRRSPSSINMRDPRWDLNRKWFLLLSKTNIIILIPSLDVWLQYLTWSRCEPQKHMEISQHY